MTVDIAWPRDRRATPAAVLIAITLAACSATPPSPGPTNVAVATASPAPTATLAPTAVVGTSPTPGPTFRPLTAADIGDGWTLIATDSNVSGIARIAILGPVKVGTAYAFECVGHGTAVVSFAAAGGTVTLPPEGDNEFFSKTYACPTLVQESLTNQFDLGGVSISPNVDPSAGLIYALIVGTQPG